MVSWSGFHDIFKTCDLDKKETTPYSRGGTSGVKRAQCYMRPDLDMGS
jgi:hypothetical protein